MTSRQKRRSTSWRPAATLPAELWDPRHKLLRTSEPLTWLHQHWDLSGSQSAPRGASSRAKTVAMQAAWRVIRPCLARYWKEEQDVLANLVRVVDLLAKRVDDLAANEQRMLAAVRSDLMDLSGHLDESIADLSGGA
jgi:hypothetical protein